MPKATEVLRLKSELGLGSGRSLALRDGTGHGPRLSGAGGRFRVYSTGGNRRQHPTVK